MAAIQTCRPSVPAKGTTREGPSTETSLVFIGISVGLKGFRPLQA